VTGFKDRVCHVISVTDPYGCILVFIDWDLIVYDFNFSQRYLKMIASSEI
jgi:hypothetical protein